VWYVPTGKLRFRFDNTHPGKALTALNFDAAKRRLLTGKAACSPHHIYGMESLLP
jgi:hypothetical protein